ncbi:MAG: 1-deoxy-D-xylulose-5-phosphate reductoisomerase [Candidatus Omnitrophota bacterium]
MKRIAILGSTGSIGKSALDVIEHFPGEFRVIALSTNSNIDLLRGQIKKFHPALVCVNDDAAALKLRFGLSPVVKILSGQDGLREIVQDERIDIVLLAISGSAALEPLLASIEAGRDVALANKEALVMAGSIIMAKAFKKKIKIMPVDSEQSAIWQCLEGEYKNRLKKIYLTASGGPFRKTSLRGLRKVSKDEVLTHPCWKMGKKISVDSATLMNKGFELIEAMYLFDAVPREINILVHPEAIVHSMVEFSDGVVKAQLSITDMRIPIQYALSYPKRLSNCAKAIDFLKLGSLNFEKPDFKKFPCLELAYYAAENQGTLPCVLNAANEISVDEFLKDRLRFIDIPKIIEKVLRKHSNITQPGFNDIKQADAWARQEAYKIIETLGTNTNH